MNNGLDAVTELTPEDETHCKVIFDHGKRKCSAIFPNRHEAEIAVNTALIHEVGGYHDATISDTKEGITHRKAVDWLFNDLEIL